MQIRRKPEIYFTFASYLIPPQINKSGVHLLQICSLWKNNVCFLQKFKQTCCKSICMHHCFPTFTQTPNPKPPYPQYHSILSHPRRASLLVPLPLDLSTSLPPEFCPLPIVCFLCGTWHRAFMQKHCQLEEIINSLIKK